MPAGCCCCGAARGEVGAEARGDPACRNCGGRNGDSDCGGGGGGRCGEESEDLGHVPPNSVHFFPAAFHGQLQLRSQDFQFLPGIS